MLSPDAGSALPAIIERLDRSEGPALDAVLEEARGVLDLLPQESMGPPVAAVLLRWPAECPASAQRERWCRDAVEPSNQPHKHLLVSRPSLTLPHAPRGSRLVSYAAIMHGCSLLSALPAIAHEMAQRLDAADEQVSEEILRTVGNLARYALSAQSTPQSLVDLVGPLLEPDAHRGPCRGPRASQAVQRALAEAPLELLRPAAVLPVLHLILSLFSSRDAASAEAVGLLASAVELVAAELPEVDVHFVMQHAVAASHAAHEPQRRSGLELLRVMAPLLRRRASGSGGAALRGRGGVRVS